ncbi:MAG: hypothetical protein L6Q71_01415 [Planctomycetes bacterium]|nr:hypothetical protein [Planctomycetota bacterium]
MSSLSCLWRRALASIVVTVPCAMLAPASAADIKAYEAAVPALKEAGGANACVKCFLERYAPAEINKAFAVSKDGAYGGRWGANLSMAEARSKALDSCRQKPEFKSANPCVVFFENDKLVWSKP